MDRYQELKLIGSAENQERLIDDITKTLVVGWERLREIEERDRKKFGLPSLVCFSLSDSGYGVPVSLQLTKDENNYYCVSSVNLRSRTARALTEKEQNDVIERFYRTFVEGRAERFNIRANLTTSDNSPKSQMSPELLETFKIWTARSEYEQSNDLESQYAFIIQAHKEGSLISFEDVKSYLSGTLPKSDAKKAALFYEQGRELLKHFDS